MVATDMMAEYVRQLLDLDEASLNATLNSLSRYAETRGGDENRNNGFQDFKMPDGMAVGVQGKADKGLSLEAAGVAMPDGLGAAGQGKADKGWAVEAADDAQHLNALAEEETDASLPPGTTALCEAMATLSKSLSPQSAAAAQDLLTAAVAEIDVQSGAEAGSDYNLLQGVQKVLEKQQQESAMRLLGIMQMEMQGRVAQQLAPPPWPGVPSLAAPGLPPGLADDWAGPWGESPAMVHPMQMQDPGVPNAAGFVPPDASLWLGALKGQQNQTMWYGGSQVPPAPMAHRHATTPKDSGAAIGGRATAAGQRQHRQQSTREANHASTKPAAPRWKAPPAPQEASEETIRAHLRWLQNVDPARVLLVRKINRLGFDSPTALTAHFSWYGPVERVLVSHSRVKTVQHPTGTVSSRLRPSGVGFVVMESPELAKIILAEGREQTVAGVAINVQMFERRQTEEGSLGSPINDEAD